MIGHLLNRSVDVWREERTPDGSGGWFTEWVRVHEDVPMRIAQPSAEERVVAMQAGARLDGRAYFRHSVDVQRGDELRSGDVVHRVVATVGPSSPGVYRRADVERVQHAEGSVNTLTEGETP